MSKYKKKYNKIQLYKNMVCITVISIFDAVTNGIENCLDVKGQIVYKTLGNLIYDGIVITYATVLVSLYDKKIKLKKTKFFLECYFAQ